MISLASIGAIFIDEAHLIFSEASRAALNQIESIIKLVSENFPITEFHKTDELLTLVGIGEAMVTRLNGKGVLTPLVHALLLAP